MDDAGCGLTISALCLLVIGIVNLHGCVKEAGYRQGQIDAAEGRWKYTPTTQRVYVEAPNHE